MEENLALLVVPGDGKCWGGFQEIVGSVEIDAESTVWPMAVIRGDDGKISIGRDTHIQDGSVIHCDHQAVIGDHVNVGHSVVIHATKIGDNCLIGNNATLLEEVEVGDYCIIGANALVLTGTKVPSYSFVVGVPAEIRPLSESQKKMLEGVTEGFTRLPAQYKREGLA